MGIGPFIALYLCTLAVILPLDVAWLSTVGRTFYTAQLGPVLLDKPAMIPAAAFYLLYPIGIVVLAQLPAVRDGGWSTVAINAAVLGFCAYATYDLTNLATTRGFTLPVAMVDLAWGTVVTTLAGVGGLALARWLNVV